MRGSFSVPDVVAFPMVALFCDVAWALLLQAQLRCISSILPSENPSNYLYERFPFIEQQKIFCFLYLSCVQYPIRSHPPSIVSQSMLLGFVLLYKSCWSITKIKYKYYNYNPVSPKATAKCLSIPHTFHLIDAVRPTGPLTLVIKWSLNYTLKPRKN